MAADATAVHIDPNTFRYRLERPAVVAGIDLDDPEAGFEAMFQLGLHPPQHWRRPGPHRDTRDPPGPGRAQ